jgi:hypothetical protein
MDLEYVNLSSVSFVFPDYYYQTIYRCKFLESIIFIFHFIVIIRNPKIINSITATRDLFRKSSGSVIQITHYILVVSDSKI